MKAEEWDQVADKYFDDIVSPFYHQETKRQLLSLIRKHAKPSLVAADLGCGIGNLLPVLSRLFSQVYAIDFSPQMVAQARKKHGHLKNVRVERQSIQEFSRKVDVAVAVNSILYPDTREIERMLDNVYSCLNSKGCLIGVFPSMDSVLHVAMLYYQRELRNGKERKEAREKTAKVIEEKNYDFLTGIQDFEGRQKFFYGFELDYRLKKAGFTNVKRKKLHYPWSATNEDYSFQNKPKPWDWLVVARK